MKTSFNSIGIIIQARMGSTRLPAKIMLPVNGRPIFQSQIDRLKSLPYPLIIATTVQETDNAIIDFADSNNIAYFRGDENDVLSRYYECAVKYKLDVVVRITSDCPLIDPVLIQKGLGQFLAEGDSDLYLSNTLDRTYPRGFDFEIFSFALLENAFRSATETFDKEHVTPYIWKNKSNKVCVKQLKGESDASHYRLTLDTAEDLKLLKILMEQHKADQLSGEEIIGLMQAHPELALINQHVEQKKN